MSLQVLIPCLDKSKEQLIELCAFLNVDSDVAFCDQCGRDGTYSFEHKGHTVTVHEVSWRGVSRARNFLIDRCSADIGLFIDDDCVLNEGYADAVETSFQNYPKAKIIRFNTTRGHWNPVHAEAGQHRRASFKDLSSFGMWGFAFRVEDLRELGVRFNEKLGAPNYLFNGEDSVFLFDCCKKTKDIDQDPFFVCDVRETKKSTWFETYNDEYFVTKGFVYSYLYGSLWMAALARMYLSYKKSYQRRWNDVLKAAKKGRYMHRHGTYELRD